MGPLSLLISGSPPPNVVTSYLFRKPSECSSEYQKSTPTLFSPARRTSTTSSKLTSDPPRYPWPVYLHRSCRKVRLLGTCASVSLLWENDRRTGSDVSPH